MRNANHSLLLYLVLLPWIHFDQFVFLGVTLPVFVLWYIQVPGEQTASMQLPEQNTRIKITRQANGHTILNYIAYAIRYTIDRCVFNTNDCRFFVSRTELSLILFAIDTQNIHMSAHVMWKESISVRLLH